MSNDLKLIMCAPVWYRVLHRRRFRRLQAHRYLSTGIRSNPVLSHHQVSPFELPPCNIPLSQTGSFCVLPASCMSSLGRPCAVQVTLVPLDHVLDQGKHKEPEYDCRDRKDHVFNRPLTILVAENSVTTN